jgi:hypothetical protein
VFTTAGSPLSALTDGPAGRSLAHGIEQALRGYLARSVVDSAVAVLGYAGPAPAMAATLRDLGARVAVSDPDPVRQCAAVLAGHQSLAGDAAPRWADVVVDLGGRLLHSADGLSRLADGAVLIAETSGSPPAILETVARYGEPALCRVAGKRLYIVPAGHALGHAGEYVAGRLRDLRYGELYLCVRQLAARRCPPGVLRLARRQCAELARRWCRTYQQAQTWPAGQVHGGSPGSGDRVGVTDPLPLGRQQGHLGTVRAAELD